MVMIIIITYFKTMESNSIVVWLWRSAYRQIGQILHRFFIEIKIEVWWLP